MRALNGPFLSAGLALAGAFLPGPALAGIVLSQAVVDIQPGHQTAQDIEVWNDGDEVAYVVAQPAEVLSPGAAGEKRVPVEDPGVGGLLVSPQRVILQPQERKLVRVAAVGERQDADRIWRVVIKPVAGPVTAPVTALKVLVGYDVLVILRPATPKPDVSGERQGNVLTLHNRGNTNVEVYEGNVCPSADAKSCTKLPGKRIYAGTSWQQTLPGNGAVTYRIAVGAQSSVKTF